MHTTDLTDADWRKSRRSSGNGACVEVTHLGHALAVRDSKNPQDPVLVVSTDEWASFITRLRQI
jgi:hypothetical protein